MHRYNLSLKEKLPEIRSLVISGDIRRAEELILQYMAGTPSYTRPDGRSGVGSAVRFGAGLGHELPGGNQVLAGPLD